MKRFTAIFIAMILVTLTAPPTLAQDTTAFRALQFGIGQNFMLREFEGRSLGYEHKITDDWSLRLALSLSASNMSYDRDYTDGDLALHPDTVWREITYTRSDDYVNRDYSATVYLIRYLESPATVRGYWGVGPRIGFDKSDREFDRTDDYQNNDIRRDLTSDTYSNRTLGLAGLLGVEWAFHERISLQLEYFGHYYTLTSSISEIDKEWQTGLLTDERNIEEERTGWYLSSGTRFGLAFHF